MFVAAKALIMGEESSATILGEWILGALGATDGDRGALATEA